MGHGDRGLPPGRRERAARRRRGRRAVCETGLPGVPRVTESIVAYDEVERTLTYAATDVPRFIRAARNRWQVSPAGPDRARARFDGALELRGLVGLLVAVPMRLRMRRETRNVLEDLKHYAEHGTPSPRKQRRLAGRPGGLVAEP